MATPKPKITKLAPGEGAGDFKPKRGRKGGRVTPNGEKRTQNPCILSPSGAVDPQCKRVYQRSVAGRQTLQQFISEKFGQGMTEKDVFMAAVAGLKSRKLGYVGAYLDSKNPGRTYNDNQAMAIVDAVMTKMGVGKNPGARLSGPSGGGRQRGKAAEKGKHGASVRQQRKQPGGRGGGFFKPEPGKEAEVPRGYGKEAPKKPQSTPKTEIQRTLEDIKAGRLTKEQLAQKLQERREGGSKLASPPLPSSAAAQRRDEAIERKATAAKQEKSAAAPTPAPEEKPVQAPTPEEKPTPESLPSPEAESDREGGLRASDDQITNLFRSKYNEYKRAALQQAEYDARKFKRPTPQLSDIQLSDEEIADAAQEAIDELSKQFEVDSKAAIDSINKKYGLNISTGQQQQEEPEQPPSAPEEESPYAWGMKPSGSAPAPKPPSEAQPQPKPPNEAESIAKDFRARAFQIADSIKVPPELNKYENQAYGMTDPSFNQNLVKMANEYANQIPESAPEDDKDEALYQINSDLLDFIGDEAFSIDPATGDYARNPNGIYVVKGMGAKTPSKPGARSAKRRLPSQRGGGGFGGQFTPQQREQIKQEIAQNPQEAIKKFKQGTLFPSGLVTDTSQTNPLEGGSTSVSPTSGPESQGPASGPDSQLDLLDEEGNPRDFTKSGPAAPPRRETARQLPLNLGRENTAAKLKQRAGIAQRRLAKEEKDLGKPPKPSRQRGRTPVQQELFTPKGNPRKFETSGSAPSSGTMRQAPSKNKGSIGMLPPREQRNNPPQTPPPASRRPNPILDPLARGIMGAGRAIQEGRKRHNASAAGKYIPLAEQGVNSGKMSYEEFSSTIRSMMR